jgi:uncharacterized protein involved in type VI secretion and phage assembly
LNKNAPLFYGKHSGIVTHNIDEKHLGRIKAKVPSLHGDKETGWAYPSVPYAGSGVGFFFIPPIGAHVWIEYEQGTTEKRPIYSCYWEDESEVPSSSAAPVVKIIKTDFATITLDDTPGSENITIETNKGDPQRQVIINNSEIDLTIGDSKVKLKSSNVSINGDALVVQ